LIGKGIDDGKRFGNDVARSLRSEFLCQPAPFLGFFEGVMEIDRRVDEKIIGDADLSLVGVDHA
jgi:hypothetical protein